MGRANGKVAIITGAGSGIGRASAILLAREGAKVVLTDIHSENLHVAAEEIGASHGEVITFTHNVAVEEDWISIMSKTIYAYGKVNVLVNSAGSSSKSDTTDEWKRVLDINLTGSYLGMKHAIPFMKQAGGGSIVNIASLAGLVGGGFNGYAASKGGIRAISRAAAVDNAKDNIRVNSVYPC